jgi:hypothetical protein
MGRGGFVRFVRFMNEGDGWEVGIDILLEVFVLCVESF